MGKSKTVEKSYLLCISGEVREHYGLGKAKKGDKFAFKVVEDKNNTICLNLIKIK